MFEGPARIEYLPLAPERRVLVIADVHGNLPDLRGVLDKAGFVLLYPNCWEDWGRGENVLVDKWVYKRRWRETGPDAPV